MSLSVCVHATTLITHGQANLRSEARAGMAQRKQFVEFHILGAGCGFDEKDSLAMRHSWRPRSAQSLC